MKYLCISLALLTLPVYINETAEEIYCISDTAIMSQQNSEILIEQSADICMPDKRVNGLVTKYREEINISKKEKNILCRIVEAEAGGENISGRMLVANVIINRVLCDEFADDIEGVVFAHSGGRVSVLACMRWQILFGTCVEDYKKGGREIIIRRG